MPFSDFLGIWELKIDPEQAQKLEKQIIEEWNNYEDALFIRDLNSIVKELKDAK
jgi:hypothetical protein